METFESRISVTLKFSVKKDDLSDFFRQMDKLVEQAYIQLYWVDRIDWPMEVEKTAQNIDPIKNVTGY